MAPDSLFGRDDEPPTDEPNEGVRVLGAEEVARAAEVSRVAKRRGPDEKKYGDRPEPPPRDVKPAMRFPLAESADAADIERPRPAPVGSEPVLSVGPPSGETQLPHWTEPATGEVPKVLIGDQDDADDEQWAAFTSSAPRWRDQDTDWNLEEDAGADLVHDAGTRVGALDETVRPADEDYLTFDDLDVPDAASPTAPPRGSAADPIKIQAGRPTPRPAPPGRKAPPRAARTPAGAGAASPGTGERPAGPSGPRGGTSSGGGGRDKQTAIVVGLAIALVALVLIIQPLAWLTLLVLVIPPLVQGTQEFMHAVRRGGFRPAQPIGLVAAVCLPIAAYNGGEGALLMVLVLTVAATMLWFLVGASSERPMANIAITLAGVLYVGVLGSFAALLLRVGHVGGGDIDQGPKYLLLAVAVTVAYDAGGYLIGSRIGRTPLSKASPNKTVEGLVAGLATAVLAGLLFGVVFRVGGLGAGQVLLFSVFCALAAPLGDLAESMLKRDLGVKDMGNLLPGHGGVLDRCDALLFVLPTAYYVLRTMGML